MKIHDSQVHPIDSTSVPYNFSSTTSPLLHAAARALNLPSRSMKSYLTQFETSAHVSSTSTSSRVNTANVNGNLSAPLEEKYTGCILVSGYNVCYVLPKEFPPKYKIGGSSTDSEGEAHSYKSVSKTPFKNRRNSVSEKTVVQFMAGLDLWVPYLSKVRLLGSTTACDVFSNQTSTFLQPPKAPYLVRYLRQSLSEQVMISSTAINSNPKMSI